MKGSGDNFLVLSRTKKDQATKSERSGSERCEYVQLGEGELKAGRAEAFNKMPKTITTATERMFFRHSYVSLYGVRLFCLDLGHAQIRGISGQALAGCSSEAS